MWNLEKLGSNKNEAGAEAGLSTPILEKVKKIKAINTEQGMLTTERDVYREGSKKEEEGLEKRPDGWKKDMVKISQMLGDKVAANPDFFQLMAE